MIETQVVHVAAECDDRNTSSTCSRGVKVMIETQVVHVAGESK